MLEQFIPLYCVLVGGAFAAGVAAIQMSQKLMVQTAKAKAKVEPRRVIPPIQD